MDGKKHSFWMSISIIWIAHLLMDFMLGVWPVYKTLVGFDLVTAGMIAGVSMFIGEGLQLYFGFLSDRGFKRHLLTLGMTLTVAVPFLAYTQSSWILFALVLCAFIGSGAFHPSAAGLVAGFSSSSKSLLLTLFVCGGTVGAALSQYVFTRIYFYFEGETWVLTLPLALITLACAVFKFPGLSTQKKEDKGVDQHRIWQVIKEQRVELTFLYLAQLALQVVVLAFNFLLPDILKERGYEEWFYLGGANFYYIMGGALTGIPAGYCIDRFGYRQVFVITILLSLGCFYFFLITPFLPVIQTAILLTLIGGTMGIMTSIAVAGGNSLVPSYASGLVSSFYMGGCSCIAGFGPMLASLLGTFFAEESAVKALQLLSFLFIVALYLLYLLPQKAKVPEQASV